MQNTFSEALKRYKAEINEEIESYIALISANVDKDDHFLQEAIGNINDVVMSGGKRIRGALLWTGYLSCGGEDTVSARRAAAGIEFIHSYLLVHDDIMDRDNVRHGVKTLHARYQDFATQYFVGTDSLHFGNSQAIILGDLLCAWGNDCIFSVDLPREQVQKAIKRMQHIVYRTGVGQMRDMYFEYKGIASESEILAMYKDKTARYTIEGPLHVGALLAGAGDEFLAILSDYAIPLGVAFQLQDDILGMYGNEEEIGKAVGADIQEGKITYLIAKTRRLLSESQRKELDTYLASKETLTMEEIEKVRALVETCGAKKETEDEIQSAIKQSLSVLDRERSSFDDTTYNFLTGMAEYMAKRSH
jgi:geranylgeranyl diphosphate synthase, type I